MRYFIAFLILFCFAVPAAFGASDMGFEQFIKSREVVATLYFPSNSDDLSQQDRERLLDTFAELRDLQKKGRLIRVEGFSSPEGDKEINFRLSFFRARAVADQIEAAGLPAEVTLTGYGDLRATSDDPNKERRVEIASYARPSTLKTIKFADQKRQPVRPVLKTSSPDLTPAQPTIDSYRVDQAIRRKIDDGHRGLAEQDLLDPETSPGLSYFDDAFYGDAETELERRYSQWRKSIDPDYKPRVSRSTQPTDDTDKRRYSQLPKEIDAETAPGLSQALSPGMPPIDALMIEQAIMEKVGSATAAPSGAVSRVDHDY